MNNILTTRRNSAMKKLFTLVICTIMLLLFASCRSNLTKGIGVENNHEYVDLGLSVKWATCNVGATRAEEYGDYFAWGETQAKSTYNWSTYKWSNDYITRSKYNTKMGYGTIDNKTQLDFSDDAARVNWGGNWRMPTDVEITELYEQCTWTEVALNGVKGYKVTSKINGKSIFLPAAGWHGGSSFEKVGFGGYYWSSSLCTFNPYFAWGISFNSYAVGRHIFECHLGQSVRAVCP